MEEGREAIETGKGGGRGPGEMHGAAQQEV